MSMTRGVALVGLCLWSLPTQGGREEDALAALASATPCCESLAELRYEPLAPDRAALFRIDARSPLIEIDTGRSFVVALQLPDLATPYTVRIRSYAVGDTVQRCSLFFPAAMLLDSGHQVVARLEPAELPVGKGRFAEAAKENRWGLPLRLEWPLVVDDPSAHFLVIHTTARGLAERSSTTARQPIPVILPGVVTVLPGSEQEVSIPHSPFGNLAVQVLPGPAQ